MADKVSCSPTADNAFGPVVRGCRGDFDFTLTFEQCFFAIAPSAAMLVLGGIRLYNLWFRRETHVYNTANALKWTKVAFLAIFAAFQLTLVIVWGIKSSLPARSYGIAAAALSFSASILMVQLSPLEHSRSLRPSNVLGVYLFFSLLFDAVILRTVWILPTFNAALRAINTAAFCIKGAILLLEAKSKRKHLIPTQDENRSPEETINFYAQSLFWWLNGLIMSGFKKILRPCDLYPIQQKYRTELLNQRFWSTWKKCATFAMSSYDHDLCTELIMQCSFQERKECSSFDHHPRSWMAFDVTSNTSFIPSGTILLPTSSPSKISYIFR